jgi:transposase-like protein
MNIHKNARLTFARRLEMIQDVLERKLPHVTAAAKHHVSVPTVRKWAGRYLAQGEPGLRDASSRPTVSPRAIAPAAALAIVELRRRFLTQARIAQSVGVSASTVSRVLARAGLSRWSDLTPSEPVVRYEHAEPGDLLHIDTKKLGRILRMGHRVTGDPRDSVPGAGWEFLFVAVDDHARIGFTQMKPDERQQSAVAFLRASVAYFAGLGVLIRRVLTDNGVSFARSASPPRAASWDSSTSLPGPIVRRPTAKPSASFSRRCASGRMAFLISIQRNAQQCSSVGRITTTGIARITALPALHRCLGSTAPETTS